MSRRVKKLLRKVIRDRNRNVLTGDPETRSAFALDKIPSFWKEKILSARMVAAYMPLPDELDLSAMLSDLRQNGAQVCFPKVDGDDMAFYVPETSTCQIKGRFGILEPTADSKPVSLAEMDLVFVPAMAFSEEGVRLGRGKGYYDKFFSCVKSTGAGAFSGLLIGVVSKRNLFLHLPSDPWDLTVNAILTEEGLIEIKNGERMDEQ